MKIALCLHGVVGNIYSNSNNSKKDYTSSGDTDFRIGLAHYQQHLMTVNDSVDVFIHSWSTQYADAINAAYQPRKQRFEEQIDFEQQTTALNYLKSRWYSTQAVVALKQQYEQENGFKYDWVMLSRFDLALMRHLIFKRYNNQVFYAARHHFEPQLPGQDQCPNNVNDGFCDFWFYSNSDTIDRFAQLYDSWQKYGLFNAHQEAYHHLCQLGVKLGFDLVHGQDFELVRYVYQDCQYSGKDFAGIQHLSRHKRFSAERMT